MPPESVLTRLLEDCRRRWLDVALASSPADRPAAEKALAEAYREGGLTPPERVCWTENPVAGALLWLVLNSSGTPLRGAVDALLDSADPGLSRGVRESAASLGSVTPGPAVSDAISATIWASARVAAMGSKSELEWRHAQVSLIRPLTRSVCRCIRDPLWQMVRARTNYLARYPCFGQHDAPRLAAAEFACRVLGIMPFGRLQHLATIARSAGWFWPMSRLAILTDRPASVNLDDGGRLHHETGPALFYAGGVGIWSWHGVPVPREVIEAPESLTVDRIEREANAEVRRVMIERFGQGRYIQESGSVLVHADETGELYRKDRGQLEPLNILRVQNSTPEPDGTRKAYWLRVPPAMTLARDAVAWTFGLGAQEYRPLSES